MKILRPPATSGNRPP